MHRPNDLQTPAPSGAKPPGPRARYPMELSVRFRRNTLAFLCQLARDYGDAVYLSTAGAEFYIFNHPDAVRDVLVTYDDHFIKGPALQRAKRSLGEGLLTSEGELHRRQRRLAQPALHPQRVARYADAMTHYAAQTRDAWRAGESIDVHDEMMRLTLRIVAKTLFDADVADEVDAIGHAMDVSVGMFTRAMAPWGPLLNWLPLPSNFRFLRAWGRLNDTIDRFIAERRAAGPMGARDDLLSRLLAATDTEGDGAGMSDRQLRDEAITLFTAGHETTAVALTFTFYLLSQNPRVEAELHAELDRVLGGRDPSAEDVERLPFTRRVLAESMRLYPPAWAVGRQVVEPCTIAGYELAKNAVVLLSQWVTHRDERWWPDPLKFNPTRFDETSRAARPRWAYFPFGGGSRGCIGESFAWMEAILVLATLAQRWTMRFEGADAPKLQPLITLRPAGPVRMRLELAQSDSPPETSIR